MLLQCKNANREKVTSTASEKPMSLFHSSPEVVSAAWSCIDSLSGFLQQDCFINVITTPVSAAQTTADCTPLRAGSNLPLCLENIQYFHKQPPSTTQQTLPAPCYGLEIKKKKEEKIPCLDSGAKLRNVA